MKTDRLYRRALLLILATSAVACGYSGIEHALIASKTFDVWRDFDSSFYTCLTATYDTGSYAARYQHSVRKFYLIGTMLPDLLDPTGLDASKQVIEGLHDAPFNWLLVDPLKIQDATYDTVMNDSGTHRIDWHNDAPNYDLAKLKEMVDYAKAHNYSPFAKSLIYGAYYHVVEDLQAGVMQQPSLWGSDYLAETQDAKDDWEVLADAETQSNLFEPTYYSQADWTSMSSLLYSKICDWEVGGQTVYVISPNPMQFWFEYDTNDPPDWAGWQTATGFYAIDSFVKLANTYFDVNGLTPGKLKAYLHGYAITWFFLAGYDHLDANSAGGIYSHPNWTFSDINSYVGNLSADYLDSWVLDALKAYNPAYRFLAELALRLIIRLELQAFVPEVGVGSNPWYTYFESQPELYSYRHEVERIHQLYGESMPSGLETSLQRQEHYLDKWQGSYRGQGGYDPRFRTTYRNEADVASSLYDEMKQNLEQGPDYLATSMNYHYQAGADVYRLARKAGLVGGMYLGGDSLRQPGIANACFVIGNSLLYYPFEIPFGDPTAAYLHYDIVPFTDFVTIKVLGKNRAGQCETLAKRTIQSCRYLLCRDSLGFELQKGITQVAFVIYANNSSSGDGTLMFDSDYGLAYQADSNFTANQLYQQRLKSGDPTRTRMPDENPLTGAQDFWPYVLRLYDLAPPTGLTATLSNSTPGPLAVELNWTDNSSYEYGYRIEKTVNHSLPTYIPSVGLLPPNTIHYEDVNVAFGDTYRYRVWAERDSWKSDTTPYAQVAIIVSSDSLPLTAFNNQEKVAIRGNDVHMTYYTESQGVMYVHSSDGGKTWDLPERVDLGCYEYAAAEGASPAIALDSAGNPYILWPGCWWRVQSGNPWSMSYFVSSRNQYGQWFNDSSPALAFTFGFNYPNSSNPPQLSPPAASFGIRHDSGCAALNYAGKDSVSPCHPGTYFAQFLLKAHPKGEGVGVLDSIEPYSNANSPTMLVDTTGRRVVISAYAGSEDDSIIRISYMDAGQSSFSDTDLHSGLVYGLTATLENDSNVLLAWVNGGDSLEFGRLIRGTSGYAPSPGKETVTDSGVDLSYTHPKFVANPLNLPMLVYEYYPESRGNIQYALRTQSACWFKDTVFTSNYYLCYPEGCAGSRLRVFASASSTQGVGPYTLVSGSVMLPWYQFPPTSNSLASWPNSGRKLVIQPDGLGVHVVYDAGDSIKYAYSHDGGETWSTPTSIDQGDYPSVALDAAGLPTIVYSNNGILCKMMRTDSTWTAMTLNTASSTPPAVDRVQAAIPSSYPYCAFPSFDAGRRKAKIVLVKVDTLGGTSSSIAETTAMSIDSFVSVACAPDGPICVAWQRANCAMCATFSNGTPPSYVKVADSAIHPFITVYGDNFYLVWRHSRSGQLQMASRPVSGGTWNATSIASTSGDYPVYSKANTLGWQQWDASSVDDVWAKTCTLTCNLSESPNVSSKYLNMDVRAELIDSVPVVDAIYGIWTENVGTSLYSIRFRRLDLQGGQAASWRMSPSHNVVCGHAAASPFCVNRCGLDSSGAARFDYGQDSLNYLIRYINPSYGYLAEFIAPPGQVSEQSIRSRGEEIARLRFGPGRPDTVRLVIPRRCYENGTTLPFSLVRLSGERVALAGLRLYAFSTRRIQREGVMALTQPIPMKAMLYDAAPCPSRGRTMLRFQIPRPTHVTVKMYDASGRKVKTILDSERPAGVYTLTWDGRDDRGRVSSNGIYFCTMKAGDYKAGRKLIISR
ncbi:MAG TPA: FlgD immunoglobulin-like domain containing protein [bacterium]|nr:FlgD immunoglobulin-like domain containing protein [bacterium]